jgi:hypothetical protein
VTGGCDHLFKIARKGDVFVYDYNWESSKIWDHATIVVQEGQKPTVASRGNSYRNCKTTDPTNPAKCIEYADTYSCSWGVLNVYDNAPMIGGNSFEAGNLNSIALIQVDYEGYQP